MPKFVNDWRDAWWVQDFRRQFFLSTTTLLAALILMRLVVGLIETRSGVVLPDPLLQLFSPIELKWITYSLIYSSVLLGIISLGLQPFALLLAMRTLILVILMRIVCMYLLPLDPPADIIPLSDPLMQWLGMRAGFTRDLFFSWHASMIALLALTIQWKDIRIILACLTLAVSTLILLQHAHYTIDVFAAPCFSYMAFCLAREVTVDESAAMLRYGRREKPGFS